MKKSILNIASKILIISVCLYFIWINIQAGYDVSGLKDIVHIQNNSITFTWISFTEIISVCIKLIPCLAFSMIAVEIIKRTIKPKSKE